MSDLTLGITVVPVERIRVTTVQSHVLTLDYKEYPPFNVTIPNKATWILRHPPVWVKYGNEIHVTWVAPKRSARMRIMLLATPVAATYGTLSFLRLFYVHEFDSDLRPHHLEIHEPPICVTGVS